MKLQGRRDYGESVNRKKQEQTGELSFGLQMFERRAVVQLILLVEARGGFRFFLWDEF